MMIMWYPSGMVEPDGWWDDFPREEYERIHQYLLKERPSPPLPLYVWSILIEEPFRYHHAYGMAHPAFSGSPLAAPPATERR